MKSLSWDHYHSPAPQKRIQIYESQHHVLISDARLHLKTIHHTCSTSTPSSFSLGCLWGCFSCFSFCTLFLSLAYQYACARTHARMLHNTRIGRWVCEIEMTRWVRDALMTQWCHCYTTHVEFVRVGWLIEFVTLWCLTDVAADWVNESSACHDLNESSQSDEEWVDWLCVSHFDDALMSLSPLHYTHWICDTLTIFWCRRYICNGHWVRESEMTHWVRDTLTILWCCRYTCNGHRVRGGEMTLWVRDTLTILSMSLLLHTCNGHRVRERGLIDFAKLWWITDVTATTRRWSWRSFECVLRMTQQWCMMMEKSYGEIVYVYMFTCMYVQIYVYIHVYRHINLQICIYVYVWIFIHHAYMLIYMCVCVYICVYT